MDVSLVHNRIPFFGACVALQIERLNGSDNEQLVADQHTSDLVKAKIPLPLSWNHGRGYMKSFVGCWWTRVIASKGDARRQKINFSEGITNSSAPSDPIESTGLSRHEIFQPKIKNDT